MPRNPRCSWSRMWGTGEIHHVQNPDMPWNEEIRAAWARMERLAVEPRDLPLLSRSGRKWTCGRSFRQSACPLSSSSMLTTRSSRLRGARTSLIAYRARNMLSCRAATCTTSSNRGVRPSRRSPSSSPASRPTWPTIGCSRRCCSPTSSTRRAGPRRWATVTGMRCLMRTTPSSGRSSLGFVAAR